jgi:uncharacterized alpha-E superfamily protein
MLSRVADSLYWMSRYLERAEHTARQLDVHLNLALDQSPAASAKRRARILDALSVPRPALDTLDDYRLVEMLTFDTDQANSIVSCIAAARENARQVREQLSTEMWQQLNQLYLFVRGRRMAQIWAEQPYEFMQAVKQGAHLFQGITDSTLSHGQGWQFIELGRYIERATSVARLLAVEFRALYGVEDITGMGDDHLNWLGLLKCCTAFEAYSKVYTALVQPRNIAEFLLLDRDFPHSVCFAVDRIQAALDAIAETTDTHRGSRVYRLSGRLRAALDYGHVDEIMSQGLEAYLADIEQQCSQIHDAVFQLYISYPLEDKLAA